MSEAHLRWLGCELSVECETPYKQFIFDSLQLDFGHFLSAKTPVKRSAVLTIRDRCELKKIPGVKLLVSRGKIIRTTLRSRWIEYPDQTVTCLTRDSRGEISLTIYAADFLAARERLYLSIHSLLGEALEKKGFIRMHAMSFAGPHGAVAILAPSGIGKSTATSQVLNEFSYSCFGDEISLLRNGRIYAFPCRVALDNRAPAAEPTIDVYGRKRLFPIPTSRVAQDQPLAVLFFATRGNTPETSAKTKERNHESQRFIHLPLKSRARCFGHVPLG